MTEEALTEAMIPVCRRWVSAVHRRDKDSIDRIAATLPEGRWDVFAVVLGAMIEPDRRPEELLAWMDPINDPDSPEAREVRRLESLGVSPSRARLLATQAVEQDPRLAGWSPPVRAEQAAARDRARQHDRDRKQRQRGHRPELLTDPDRRTA